MAIYNHQLIDMHKQISAAMAAAYVENNFSVDRAPQTFEALQRLEHYVLSHIDDEDQSPKPWRWQSLPPDEIGVTMTQQLQDRIDELELLIAKYEQVIAECVCFPSAQIPEGRARMLSNNIDLARDRYRTARYFAQSDYEKAFAAAVYYQEQTLDSHSEHEE